MDINQQEDTDSDIPCAQPHHDDQSTTSSDSSSVSDVPAKDRCRRSYAQRHPPQKSEPVKKSEKNVSNAQKSSQNKRIVACHFYHMF